MNNSEVEELPGIMKWANFVSIERNRISIFVAMIGSIRSHRNRSAEENK